MTIPKGSLECGLRTEQLRALTAELIGVKEYPPIVHKGKGIYEGDILGFVKGLRFSARVIYCLREQLSDLNYCINWGHLLNDSGKSCSPECDIIVHTKGEIRQWNGATKDPVMNFCFVPARYAQAVISCKSKLDDIDAKYPKSLKKYGVKQVFLIAECCKYSRYKFLRQKARHLGYSDLHCLYFLEKDDKYTIVEKIHLDFITRIRKALTK